MKIAFISSLFKPTDPYSRGGQESWAYSFITESVKRGHSFNVYATEKSTIPSPNVTVIPLTKELDVVRTTPYFANVSSKELLKYLSTIYAGALLTLKSKQDQYDLVIDSTGTSYFSANWGTFSIPLITIGHFPTTNHSMGFFSFMPLPKNVYFILPSRFQFNASPFIADSQKTVIQHGILTDEFKDMYENGYQMVWYGRLDPRTPKGGVEALQVSQKTAKKLAFYPYIENQEYYETQVNPLLTDKVTVIANATRQEILANKKVFILPLQWDEPFGLVMLEAMASGIPIVALARGAAPEIIKDGMTGYLVNPSDSDIRGKFSTQKTGIDGLCEAIENIYSMPKSEYSLLRQNARNLVLKNFSVERMVDQYEEFYKKITVRA